MGDIQEEKMSYRIIVDSCGELTKEMKQSGRFVSAPLSMEVMGRVVTDDETFCQEEFLRLVSESPKAPKSSCPSPEAYLKLMETQEERVYVVTLSSELSGSYNSACLAKNLYEEKYGDSSHIHVFDSRSASVGETLIALEIQKMEERGLSFADVVEGVSAYIGEQHTYFVLENLETLRKNGRLTSVKAFVASALNIKPVMGSTAAGTICQLGQARGMKKALAKMVDHVVKDCIRPQERILAIAHCNCFERAKDVERMIRELLPVKDSFVVDTAGISTMYANDGGVIVVV